MQLNQIPDIKQLICSTLAIEPGLFESFLDEFYITVPNYIEYRTLREYNTAYDNENLTTILYFSANFTENNSVFIPMLKSNSDLLLLGISNTGNTEEEICSAISTILDRGTNSLSKLPKHIISLVNISSRLTEPVSARMYGDTVNMKVYKDSILIPSFYENFMSITSNGVLLDAISYVCNLLNYYSDISSLLEKHENEPVEYISCKPLIRKINFNTKDYYVYLNDDKVISASLDNKLVNDSKLLSTLTSKLALLEVYWYGDFNISY